VFFCFGLWLLAFVWDMGLLPFALGFWCGKHLEGKRIAEGKRMAKEG
jgi:hypothetical protein